MSVNGRLFTNTSVIAGDGGQLRLKFKGDEEHREEESSSSTRRSKKEASSKDMKQGYMHNLPYM